MMKRRTMLVMSLAAALAGRAEAPRPRFADARAPRLALDMRRRHRPLPTTFKRIHNASAAGSACTSLDSQSGKRWALRRRLAFRDGVDVQAAAGGRAAVAGGSRSVSARLRRCPSTERICWPIPPWSKRRSRPARTRMTVRDLCSAAVTLQRQRRHQRPARRHGRAGGAHGVRPQHRRRSHALRSHRAGAQQQSAGRSSATPPRRAPWSTPCSRSSRRTCCRCLARAADRLDDRGAHRARPGARGPAEELAVRATRPAPAQNGAFNDLVITWPPERRPIFIAVYMSESKLGPKELTAAHAEIGALIGREKWP